MMYFQIPFEPVEIKPWAAVIDIAKREAEERKETYTPPKPQKMSFKEFSTFIWLDDTRAVMDGQQQSVVKVNRWLKVIDKFETSKPGDWIELDDTDFVTLKEIVEKPQRMFQNGHMQILRACMPYVDAVLGAKSERPAIFNGAKDEARAPSA